MRHDTGYKALFSDPEMLASLLRDFVPESFIADLDFGTLERCSGSHVTDDLRERHDDMIWRVRWKGDTWCYLYVLLEFQSSVDHWMAVRVLAYTALLWQDLIRTGEIREGDRLPPVFPIVLYNGGRRWTARQDVAELLPDLSGPLAACQPRQRYFLLEESQVSDEHLHASAGIAALLLRLERTQKPEDLLPLLDELAERLQEPRYRRLRRAFTIWIARVVLQRAGMATGVAEINDLLEVRAMLAERVTQWKDEYIQKGVVMGREEGISIGESRGMALILRDLLESRLGPPPLAVEEALTAMTDSRKLRGLMQTALRAASYADFLEEAKRRQAT